MNATFGYGTGGSLVTGGYGAHPCGPAPPPPPPTPSYGGRGGGSYSVWSPSEKPVVDLRALTQPRQLPETPVLDLRFAVQDTLLRENKETLKQIQEERLRIEQMLMQPQVVNLQLDTIQANSIAQFLSMFGIVVAVGVGAIILIGLALLVLVILASLPIPKF